jgi:hypothetical protein
MQITNTNDPSTVTGRIAAFSKYFVHMKAVMAESITEGSWTVKI